MDDLVTWLRAQLDEDEREILRHGPPLPPAFGVAPSRFTTMQAGTTVLMNPARVLAEVAAKRRILDAWDKCNEIAQEPHGGDLVAATRYGLEIAMRALAVAYADYYGFREEWRQ